MAGAGDADGATTVEAFFNAVSTANSTSATLGSGGVFTGTFEDVLKYTDVTVIVLANVASAASGFVIQWSSNGTNVDDSDSYTLPANTGKQYSFGVMARYMRIVYTNGGSAQSTFRLQTLLKSVRGKPSSHRVDGTIVAEDDAELVKAVLTGKDPNGTYRNVGVDLDGHIVIVSLTGFGSDFVFGDVVTSSLAMDDVRRTAYTEQTSNAQRSILSGNANDTAAGTGARTVRITYLDSTGAGPFTETVTMNGVTPVNTVSTTICFIESIDVLTAGSGGANAGTLTLKAAAAGGGATIGTVNPTDNQTFWAHHYIPTGKVCNITGLSVNHNGTTVGSGGLFILKALTIGVANAVELQVGDFHRLYGQSSTIPRTYTSPIKVTGPARLTVYVTPETSSSTTYRASIDFFEP